MAPIDNEATTICCNSDDATQIIDSNASSVEEAETPDNETSAQMTEDKKNNHNHKTAKTVGGIAVGGVLLGTAASVFSDMKGAPTATLPTSGEDQDADGDAEEGIMLPELTVEAEAVQADNAAPGVATAYAEVSGVEPEASDQSYNYHAKPEDYIAAQVDLQPEEDSYGEDIPIVSVDISAEDEGDIQILGVTQDISTGYNVGHLSVDGEEVVVIDVDGDMIFDSMVVDINHDGNITSDEIIDISQQSLSLNDIPGHSDIFLNPLDSTGEAPDYLSEIAE